MRRRGARIVLAGAVAILLLLVLGRVAVGFYIDILWYDALGYLSTYWTRLRLGLGVRATAALLAGGIVMANLWWAGRDLGPVRVRRRYGNIEFAERIPRNYVLTAAVGVSVLSGWWLAELQFHEDSVLTVASWLRHVRWGAADPLFGHDIAFYVFTLPVAATLLGYLVLVAVWSTALVALVHVLVGGIQWLDGAVSVSRPARRHLGLLLAGLLVLFGIRYWLGRYFLVVDGTGVAGSLGFTDVHARLPLYGVMAGLSLTAAGAVVYGAWRGTLRPPAVGFGALIVGGLLVGTAYPILVQKVQVEPNELTREAAYIRWNMDFTRRAYGLLEMDRVPFPYRRGARADVDRLQSLLSRLPLWDLEPLERTFNETQTLYPYYGFSGVDYDRYGEPGRERQVGIGVREIRQDGLDPTARTWQSLRLNPSYIRGLGAVVAATHVTGTDDVTPTLWVRNINPVVSEPDAPGSVDLTRPDVFFGESMSEYAIVVPGRDGAFTGEPGIDYPAGIPLSSFLRVLAFSWRFGDETLLFSGEVSRDSRMIFRRSLRSRLEELAPFLTWDADPLPVIHDGGIVWLVDGYTTSASFPLSRTITLGRSNVRYLRNSVKAVVDAISGDVSIYTVADDPLLTTYRRVFPELIQPREAMPAELLRHLRYPQLALLAQAEILQEYHLDRVEPFYSGQDVWQRPQEVTRRSGVRHYTPLYAIMPVPLEERTEFLAVLPFIARARQNMTAVLMARNDADRYGELTLFELPRDQQIPGPGQVQAVIEQDPEISPELSLLRQRGSGVDMGRLRLVALDSSIVYIQPIFLSADENPIPELWRVVVSDGREVQMSRTLEGAMAILGLAERTGESKAAAAAGARSGWPGQALDLLDQAAERIRAGDWVGYGRTMESLRSLLERLNREEMERSQ